MPGKIKRLYFEEIDPDSDPKGQAWRIINKKKQMIGIIFWDKIWKRHVFQTDDSCKYSFGCLQEIVDFIKGLGGKP